MKRWDSPNSPARRILILVERTSRFGSELHDVPGKGIDGTVEAVGEEFPELRVRSLQLGKELKGSNIWSGSTSELVDLADSDGRVPVGEERLEVCSADAIHGSSSE
jgi:hypothetical protein